ncbi:MAG: ABC transporter ATP-binding protein [Candidatus Rokubacteria bacterium]|nr:ABC transporter ATP-binding protein [Candidatus Rokubacteria bacterium]
MTTANAAVLETRGLVTGYDEIPIVRGVDLAIHPGVLTSIIGPNGAGKSTVLKALMGLLRPWEGDIFLKSARITREAAHLRVGRGLAYVPQGRIVFPTMTVLENLEVGAFVHRRQPARVREALDRVLHLFPVLADRRRQLAGTMSGGEQQMLAVGRALMTTPDIVLLDEPSLGLSPKYVGLVFSKLVELKQTGLTVAMVEQKASRALEVSDLGYVLSMGRVAFQGRAADLLADERVKRLYLGEGDVDADAAAGGAEA